MADSLQALDRAFYVHAHQETLDERIGRHTRVYRCRCGNPLFFANTQCLACGSQLGYLPDEGRVAALEADLETGHWRAYDRPKALKFCANRALAAVCNWMVFADNASAYCVACRLNRTIPDLSVPDNVGYWADTERAKRRMVSQLLAMGLPVHSKLDEDPERGLMFDFLRAAKGGPPVMTGHASGLITINVEEADNAKREAIRHAMHEPYRSLLGHFRHEIGHYYWARLIAGGKWLAPFRGLFGDERASYADALKRNYEQGPPADWANRHITAYAAMHPWEDWAETWAHYMHFTDSLGTALGYGVDLKRDEGRVRRFGPEALYEPEDPYADRFLELVNSWLRMTVILNELSRSMGQLDFYPLVMSAPVVAKLQFIQMVVADSRAQSAF
jgi:hypothetical protein